MIRIRDLDFRHCEGYYSRHERACTWPCSVVEMDPKDGMVEVYRAMVLWADVVILATPIRWGNASSLYYKLAERLNTVQNQITVNDRVLIRNKVASFIVTGGQDNVQGVVGQLNSFFTDLQFRWLEPRLDCRGYRTQLRPFCPEPLCQTLDPRTGDQHHEPADAGQANRRFQSADPEAEDFRSGHALRTGIGRLIPCFMMATHASPVLA